MPHSHQFDGDLLRVQLSGELRHEEFDELLSSLRHFDDTLDVVPDRLFDLSAIEIRNPDFRAVQDLAHRRRVSRFRNHFRTAIIAPHAVAFGYARMFQILNDNPQIEIRIFETQEAAEQWLRPA